jgi:hypothetical protein
VYPRKRSARGEATAEGRRLARAARVAGTLLIGLAGSTAAPALAKGQGRPSPCVSGPANVQHGKNGGGKAVGVPEPASWILMLIGAAGVGALTRRRRAEATDERRTLSEGSNG